MYIVQLPVSIGEGDGNAILSNCSSDDTFSNIIKHFTDGKEESVGIENEDKCRIKK